MTKQTVGPWGQCGQYVTGPHGVSLAFCGEATLCGIGYSYATSKAECISNAKLMASAPELRDALQKLVLLYEADEGCRTMPEYVAAIAALEKAKP